MSQKVTRTKEESWSRSNVLRVFDDEEIKIKVQTLYSARAVYALLS